MRLIQNPYDNRKSVIDPCGFYGRRDDIIRIMRRITSQSCSIQGEPRIGSTSLLQYLAHPDGARSLPEFRYYLGTADNYLFVLVELQNLPVRNTLGLWRYLFDRLSEEAKKSKRENDHMRGHYQNCLESRDEYEIQMAFERYLKEISGRVVLLFDDFEIVINDFDKVEVTNSTQKLRALTQNADLYNKLNYVITSRDPIEQLFRKKGLEKTLSPFFNILSVDCLGLLDKDAASQMIREPLYKLGTGAPQFTHQDIDFILQLSGLHPDLIKVSSSYLFEEKLRGVKDWATVQRAIEEDQHVRWLMERLWERVKEAEAQEGSAFSNTLISLAKGKEPTSLDNLYMLEKRALIDISTDPPKIFSGIFRHFILYKIGEDGRAISPLESKNIELKPTIRSVRLNGRSLKLTSLESKLFHHLANNIGQTCNRSELVQAVWNDNPPRSRDALEQLIKRLRKKIEQDPDRPQLLLNIRSQGYLLRKSEVNLDQLKSEQALMYSPLPIG